MIEYLRGTLMSKSPDHVVVDVGGVGYGADVPRTTSATLGEEGSAVELFIHFHFTDQAMRLFGFATAAEREIFMTFISISGIGPRTALGILSAIDAGAFAVAVVREDYATLTKLPGVGKKTAERLVVELRDKLKVFAAAAREAGGGEGGAEGAEGTSHLGNASAPKALRETVAALVTLGCRLAVAERAAQRAFEILGEDAQVPDLVREGLKHRY